MAKTKKIDSTSFHKRLLSFQMVYDMINFWVFLLSRHKIVPQKTFILTSNPNRFPETQMQQISKFSKLAKKVFGPV